MELIKECTTADRPLLDGSKEDTLWRIRELCVFVVVRMVLP
jgi:hypothetical protein